MYTTTSLPPLVYANNMPPKQANKAKKARGPTKLEQIKELAEMVDLPKTKIEEVLGALETMLSKYLNKEPYNISLGGLMKIKRIDKPALPAREVRNPSTGEMVMAKPKDAYKTVRISALKGLKDMV